jgi:serine/threonine-protein kinase
MFAWIGCGSIALLMFWIRIPAAMTRSAAIAREREAEADSLLGSTPSRSVMLYRSALALACDAEYEEALEQKLHRIDEQLLRTTDEGDPRRRHQNEGNTVAGRYTITDELGRGANGVVYRASDEVLGREVAIKELPVQLSNDEFVAPRFRQEARALAKLNHPNIVQVYDFIEHQKRMWMAIELVEGGNLASYLARQGFLTAQEACRLGAKIAEAVAFAHERGVVHRDLKPLNVLLADEKTPKVADFGLAKLSEGGVDTLEGAVMGSPHYMSPEQAEGGSISHSTDIYSLGVILYQMLTGQVPFEGEIASVLAQHIRKPPRRLRDVAPDNNIPPKLEKLVLSMLAKSVEKRPPEMREVAATLARLSRRHAHA